MPHPEYGQRTSGMKRFVNHKAMGNIVAKATLDPTAGPHVAAQFASEAVEHLDLKYGLNPPVQKAVYPAAIPAMISHGTSTGHRRRDDPRSAFDSSLHESTSNGSVDSKMPSDRGRVGHRRHEFESPDLIDDDENSEAEADGRLKNIHFKQDPKRRVSEHIQQPIPKSGSREASVHSDRFQRRDSKYDTFATESFVSTTEPETHEPVNEHGVPNGIMRGQLPKSPSANGHPNLGDKQTPNGHDLEEHRALYSQVIHTDYLKNQEKKNLARQMTIAQGTPKRVGMKPLRAPQRSGLKNASLTTDIPIHHLRAATDMRAEAPQQARDTAIASLAQSHPELIELLTEDEVALYDNDATQAMPEITREESLAPEHARTDKTGKRRREEDGTEPPAAQNDADGMGDDLDYAPEILKKMKFSELQEESFDHDPSNLASVLPKDKVNAPLEKQLEIAVHLPSEQRQRFFASLPMQDWELAGRLLVKSFTSITEQLQEVRRERRRVASLFEAEVARRHTALSQEEAIVGEQLRDWKDKADSIGKMNAKPPTLTT